jgi:parallel beta-helix repeat protein
MSLIKSAGTHLSLPMFTAVAVALVAMLLLLLASTPVAAQTSRSPISIIGNSQFTSANGVTSGSGTQSDPYIIQGLTITASSANGIDIENTTAYFIVRNCLVENGGSTYDGIYLDNAVNGTIENNICENNNYGIYLNYSSYNNLINNTCRNNSCGICLSGWFWQTPMGLYQFSSSYNNLINNTCGNNFEGIILSSSSNNTLTGNNCDNNLYNFGVYGFDISDFDQNIDTSNLVNGKPIYYLEDNAGVVIGPSLNAGYLGLVGCDNIKVENLVLGNNRQGILLAFTENSLVKNCVFSNNYLGIYLYSSSHDNLTGNTCENDLEGIGGSSSYNTISNNTCENNGWDGIDLEGSSNNTLTGNTCGNDNVGIWADGSNNTVSGNTCENSGFAGIGVSGSSNTISGNTCENDLEGIGGSGSSYNTISNNTCSNDRFGIYLDNGSSYNILDNSTCSTDIIGIYLKSSSNNTISGSACSNNLVVGIVLSYSSYDNLTNNTCENNDNFGIYLISSSYNNMTGNTCENNSYGIWLHNSSYDNLTGNTCDNNGTGIYLDPSSYDSLTGNNCSSNTSYGIHLDSSSNNDLTGNICSNDSIGIDMTGYSTSNVVANNTCENNSSNVIYQDPTSTGNVFSNNVIAPIHINGNDNFTGINGVISGSGTADCPYILQNWTIDASGADGIDIQNTTKYFVIQNCLIENCGGSYDGIYLDNVINGTIENNTCDNNGSGICLDNSSYDNLTGNTCENNSYGIHLTGTSCYDNFINGICSGNTRYDIHIGSGCNSNVFDLFWTTSTNRGTRNVLIKPPNTPTNLAYSPTSPSSDNISAYDRDNYWSSISSLTVYFVDNSTGSAIGNSSIPVWGGRASVIWYVSSPGTHTFCAYAKDNYGGLSYSSSTLSFSLTVTILPTSATLDVGQFVKFTSTVSNGTPPYKYQWYLNGSPVWGATSSTWTFKPTSAGSDNVCVIVTDHVGATAMSNTATVTVNRLPSVKISPSSATLDVDNSVTFTAIASNGTTPYTYLWYLNGSPVSGATSSTWTFTPASAGSYRIYVVVTDNAGATATSNTATVTVNRLPSVKISPSSATLDVGQSRLFTSSVSGGTPPYKYQWYLNGTAVSGATSSIWTFKPTLAGSDNVYVIVTDNVGVQAMSNTATVTVKS